MVRSTTTIAYIALHKMLTNEHEETLVIRLSNAYSTGSTCHFTHVANPVIFSDKSWIRNERGKQKTEHKRGSVTQTC